ncbi:MAG: diaminopimelate decarboxylase [Eubacteriales bacterium]|nr:diaminopimelate decarboxylase [Eubacteriales bacterium]
MTEQITLTKEQAQDLIKEYGSPLYVYDEAILRKRCREMKSLLPLPNYVPFYSVKANSNLELLKIIREEGFHADAMSPGEILLEEAAGFSTDEIFMVTNNISDAEIQFSIDHGILMSADSISQMERYGMLNPGGEIAVRLNPGIGTGHDDKVVTGGSCKFGTEFKYIPRIKEIAAKYDLHIVGINQHVGSLFLSGEVFFEACRRLLSVASEFPELRIIDFGGGFGVPYEGEARLDIARFSSEFTELITDFLKTYPNQDVHFHTEAGRYLVAECCELLGTVQCRKEVCGVNYVGTDIGFNVLIRPVLYDAYHEIEVFNDAIQNECVTVVGDICESGDILAKDRSLPVTVHGDIIGVKNAGAYGYSMASNYNSRLRPAEVLIGMDGNTRLIRKRDTYLDLLSQM